MDPLKVPLIFGFRLSTWDLEGFGSQSLGCRAKKPSRVDAFAPETRNVRLMDKILHDP